MSFRVLALVDRPCIGHPSGAQPDPADQPVRFVDPDAPILQALDFGVTRGDGVFETISVGRGRPQALEAHLARFVRSARMLELPDPDLDVWRRTVLAVVDRLEPADELFVKTVLTRGVEGADSPTGYALGDRSPDSSRARADGIRVVLLDRGYASTIATTAPWLLQGAKTLSYAVNRAAVREAQRRGADDVIFVSTDGQVLEGPTSNVLIRSGDSLITPPPADLGILAGTTQADLFRFAAAFGLAPAYASITPADVIAADAAWLVSSVRHAAPIRAVDGAALRIDGPLTSAFNTFLLDRTV